MLKKLVAAFGMGTAAKASADAPVLHSPYAEEHVNIFYNLLFCDDMALFDRQANGKDQAPWSVLFANPSDTAALRRIAEDEANEGRVRALAYNRLGTVGEQVPAKKLLGVIVEVPLQQGLDVLAAFSEGGVRYLNASGKIAIFEGAGNPVEGLAKELLAAARPVVDKIGPWDKQRLPPPKAGNVRLTFLVSDGLYFGEGPFAVFQKDAMAGPVLAKATQLLVRAVDIGIQKGS